MATEITEQIVREAPEIEAYKLGLLESARSLSQQPMMLPATEAAGLSPTEIQAIDFAKQGIGAFEPYIQAGAQGLTRGMSLSEAGAGLIGGIETAPQYQRAQDITQAGTNLVDSIQTAPQYQRAQDYVGGAAMGYDPTMAREFMNPYQQEVTQRALGEMRRQADIARQGQAAQAVGAGAFGGTREGVQRAEFERGIQDLMMNKIMQDYAQNYGQAQQAAQQAFEAQQGRQLAAGQGIGALTGQQASTDLARAQAMGQLGGQVGALTAQQASTDLARAQGLGQFGTQIGALGAQYANLGAQTQQLGAADTGLLAGLGGLERQVAQSQLDAIRATNLQEQMAPYQQLAFVSDIYRGAPSTQMSLTSQSAPSASPIQSAIGLGVGTLATAAGAKNMGLF